MMTTLSFSRSALDKLPTPDAGQFVYYHDSRARGLSLRVSGNGHKTFVAVYRLYGKLERMELGNYPDMDIAQARMLAQEVQAAVARGEDPVAPAVSPPTSTKKILSFNIKDLDNLPLPAVGKRVYYYDQRSRGLALGVTHNGTKTFVVYRKIHGKPERITLGRYPELTIEQARERALEINAAIGRGENPNDTRRQKRAESTLGEFFEDYLDQYAKPHKRAWQEDQAQFQRYLQAEWGGRKLSSFSKSEFQALHVRIGANHGHYAANRLLALLQVMFNKALEWDLVTANPASGIKKFREQARERFLQAEELPRFFIALGEEENSVIRDYVWLALLTGARKSNVLAMRWEEVDFNTATWRIPETKNGTPQTLPLVPVAVEILKQRRITITDSEFVFPGSGKTGHLVEPKKAWQRILDRADIQNLRMHDLRRSLGSWQAATGASLAIIGKTLNHKDLKSTGIYARLNVDPVRAAMEIAVEAILKAGTIQEK